MHNTNITGPCTFWLADMKTKGNGASWFKIAQHLQTDGKWCTDVIQEGNGKAEFVYDLTIPDDIPSGTYYLRTEIIDLSANLDTGHRDFTRGPHFYVNCLPITVKGTGKITPVKYKIPGIYDNLEKKFIVNVENPGKFTIPGPPLYNADVKV
ncbi:hypothetical protein GGI21_001591 [Coemansia aciculifera]|nr:hypothetical protein GGI21_001591 [Coemansia aciculifera]